MSDRGGCIVCGVVMGGEADPLRCHDCVENKYMEQTGTPTTFIRMTDSGPVAIEAAPLDGPNWLGALVLHAEQVHGCTHTEQLRAEAAPAPAPLDGLRETLLAEGIEAFRLTREYVGEDTLPALPGWSWFDWTEKALAALRDEGETT